MRLAHGCAPAVLWALLLLLAPGHRAGATFPAETTLSAAATEGASAGAAPALAGPLLWQPRGSPLEEAARSRAAGRPAPPAPLNEAAFAAAHADDAGSGGAAAAGAGGAAGREGGAGVHIKQQHSPLQCPLPAGRWLHTATYLAGSVFIFGGVDAASVRAYTRAVRKAVRGASPPAAPPLADAAAPPTAPPPSTTRFTGLGLESAADSALLNDVWSYSPASGFWRPLQADLVPCPAAVLPPDARAAQAARLAAYRPASVPAGPSLRDSPADASQRAERAEDPGSGLFDVPARAPQQPPAAAAVVGGLDGGGGWPDESAGGAPRSPSTMTETVEEVFARLAGERAGSGAGTGAGAGAGAGPGAASGRSRGGTPALPLVALPPLLRGGASPGEEPALEVEPAVARLIPPPTSGKMPSRALLLEVGGAAAPPAIDARRAQFYTTALRLGDGDGNGGELPADDDPPETLLATPPHGDLQLRAPLPHVVLDVADDSDGEAAADVQPPLLALLQVDEVVRSLSGGGALAGLAQQSRARVHARGRLRARRRAGRVTPDGLTPVPHRLGTVPVGVAAAIRARSARVVDRWGHERWLYHGVSEVADPLALARAAAAAGSSADAAALAARAIAAGVSPQAAREAAAYVAAAAAAAAAGTALPAYTGRGDDAAALVALLLAAGQLPASIAAAHGDPLAVITLLSRRKVIYAPSDALWQYDLASRRWSQPASLPRPAVAVSAARLISGTPLKHPPPADALLELSGSGSGGAVPPPLPELPAASTNSYSAKADDGRGYGGYGWRGAGAAGGYGATVIDPDLQFPSLAPAPRPLHAPAPRWLHSAVPLARGVVVFGGVSAGDFGVLGDVWHFDPEPPAPIVHADSINPAKAADAAYSTAPAGRVWRQVWPPPPPLPSPTPKAVVPVYKAPAAAGGKKSTSGTPSATHLPAPTLEAAPGVELHDPLAPAPEAPAPVMHGLWPGGAADALSAWAAGGKSSNRATSAGAGGKSTPHPLLPLAPAPLEGHSAVTLRLTSPKPPPSRNVPETLAALMGAAAGKQPASADATFASEANDAEVMLVFGGLPAAPPAGGALVHTLLADACATPGLVWTFHLSGKIAKADAWRAHFPPKAAAAVADAATVPPARWLHAAAAVDLPATSGSKAGAAMVVFGGCALANAAPLNDVWLYHLTDNTWRELLPHGYGPSPRWLALMLPLHVPALTPLEPTGAAETEPQGYLLGHKQARGLRPGGGGDDAAFVEVAGGGGGGDGGSAGGAARHIRGGAAEAESGGEATAAAGGGFFTTVKSAKDIAAAAAKKVAAAAKKLAATAKKLAAKAKKLLAKKAPNPRQNKRFAEENKAYAKAFKKAVVKSNKWPGGPSKAVVKARGGEEKAFLPALPPPKPSARLLEEVGRLNAVYDPLVDHPPMEAEPEDFEAAEDPKKVNAAKKKLEKKLRKMAEKGLTDPGEDASDLPQGAWSGGLSRQEARIRRRSGLDPESMTESYKERLELFSRRALMPPKPSPGADAETASPSQPPGAAKAAAAATATPAAAATDGAPLPPGEFGPIPLGKAPRDVQPASMATLLLLETGARRSPLLARAMAAEELDGDAAVVGDSAAGERLLVGSADRAEAMRRQAAAADDEAAALTAAAVAAGRVHAGRGDAGDEAGGDDAGEAVDDARFASAGVGGDARVAVAADVAASMAYRQWRRRLEPNSGAVHSLDDELAHEAMRNADYFGPSAAPNFGAMADVSYGLPPAKPPKTRGSPPLPTAVGAALYVFGGASASGAVHDDHFVLHLLLDAKKKKLVAVWDPLLDVNGAPLAREGAAGVVVTSVPEQSGLGPKFAAAAREAATAVLGDMVAGRPPPAAAALLETAGTPVDSLAAAQIAAMAPPPPDEKAAIGDRTPPPPVPADAFAFAPNPAPGAQWVLVFGGAQRTAPVVLDTRPYALNTPVGALLMRARREIADETEAVFAIKARPQ